MQFGILGTAAIARNHVIPAIEATDHEILAIASRDPDRAATMAAKCDIPRSYGSYDELLEDRDLDGVYIPLPNSMHEEWTIKAAEAGHPVLCEKPLATDAAGAERMRDRCAATGALLMEAYMHRYHPRTRRAAEVVASELGQVLTFSGSFQAPRAGGAGDLVSLTPELAGGSLMHLGCYPITIARLFLGEPIRATAVAADRRGCGVDTMFTGILEYPEGVTARISSGFDTERVVQRYRVEADNGWLEATNTYATGPDESVTLEYSIDGRHVTERFDPVDHYRLQVEHFAHCVSTGEQPLTDAEEGIRTMVVIDALRKSADRGTVVELD